MGRSSHNTTYSSNSVSQNVNGIKYSNTTTNVVSESKSFNSSNLSPLSNGIKGFFRILDTDSIIKVLVLFTLVFATYRITIAGYSDFSFSGMIDSLESIPQWEIPRLYNVSSLGSSFTSNVVSVLQAIYNAVATFINFILGMLRYFLWFVSYLLGITF